MLTLIEAGKAKLIRSLIHDLENSRNPFPLRQRWIEKCLKLAETNVALNDAIKSRAIALEQAGVKALDALHSLAPKRRVQRDS